MEQQEQDAIPSNKMMQLRTNNNPLIWELEANEMEEDV